MKSSIIPHKVTNVAIATEKINSKRNWMKYPKNRSLHFKNYIKSTQKYNKESVYHYNNKNIIIDL